MTTTGKRESERITNAAILLNGEPIFLPRPKRHHDLIHMLAQSNPIPIVAPQGFMTSDGRYVDRQEAWCIAFEAGQIGATTVHGTLFSEDIW